jgi:hypothetical protein
MTCGQMADSTTQLLTAIGTIGAVVVALVIAIFQDKLRRLYSRPILEVRATTKLPDCVKIPYIQNQFLLNQQTPEIKKCETTSYYLRVLVENNGNQTARNVEVYAKRLMRHRKSDNHWEEVPEFPPMNLVWSNSPPEQNMYLRFLPPGMSKHCDIGHILDPDGRKHFEGDDNPVLDLGAGEVSLTFDLIQKPLHKGHVVKQATYSLEIVVAADNVEAITRKIEIFFDGKWHPDLATMLRDHVGIGIESSPHPSS